MRKSVIAALTIGVLLTVGGVRAWDQWRWRGQTLHTAEARAENLALILSEYIRVSFAIDAPGATDEQLAALRRKTERYCVVMQTLTTPPEAVGASSTTRLFSM